MCVCARAWMVGDIGLLFSALKLACDFGGVVLRGQEEDPSSDESCVVLPVVIGEF